MTKKEVSERSITLSRCISGTYLVIRVVILLEVGVRQRLLHRDALVRVEGEHAVQQVQRAGVGAGEQVRPRHARLERQRLQVASRLGGK